MPHPENIKCSTRLPVEFVPSIHHLHLFIFRQFHVCFDGIFDLNNNPLNWADTIKIISFRSIIWGNKINLPAAALLLDSMKSSVFPTLLVVLTVPTAFPKKMLTWMLIHLQNHGVCPNALCINIPGAVSSAQCVVKHSWRSSWVFNPPKKSVFQRNLDLPSE